MSGSTAHEHSQILLVEDSPADRLLVERVFRDRLTVTADVEAALDAVRRQSFAAILLAQSLPRRSGLDALRDLRAASDQTPIVLMTERDDDALNEAAVNAGATACVVKRTGFEQDLAVLLGRAVGGRADVEHGILGAEREAHEILVFEVEGQRHGLFAMDVETVSRAVTIARMPAAPAGVEGYIEYRGRLVPVVDLRTRLGLEPKPVDETEHLIVVRVGARIVAVRTDRAIALVHVEARRLDPSPDLIAAGVTAVARLPDGPVFIHDLSSFASGVDPRRASIAAAPKETGG